MTDAVCLFVFFFFSRLIVNPDLRLGDVTTTNWTMTEVNRVNFSGENSKMNPSGVPFL